MEIIKLPFSLMTLNEYINAERGNKFHASSIKKRETQKCALIFKGRAYHTPISIGFLWVQKNKRKDLDNIAFAKKFILDGMVKAGAIPGDGQKYIQEFVGDAVVQGKEECVYVKIIEKEK